VLAQVPVWALELAQELVPRLAQEPELVERLVLAQVPVSALELVLESDSPVRLALAQELGSLALPHLALPLVQRQLAELELAQRSALMAWTQRHLVFGYLLQRLRHWMQLGHPL
jgi:hypothetical protein